MPTECYYCSGEGCEKCESTGYAETHARHIVSLGIEIDDMAAGGDDDLANVLDALNALADYARDRAVASVARRADRSGTAADYEKRAENTYAKIKALGLDWRERRET